MIKECKNRCSFLNNVQSKKKCTEKCTKNYSQQHDYYLVRKYMTLCAGKPFSEEWRYKTEAQKRRDNRETCEKDVCWKNDAIYSCVQDCLAQHVKNTQIFMNHFGITRPRDKQ